MSLDSLTAALTGLRDEAHRLSQEKLASGAADSARLARAQEIDSALNALRDEIDAAPAADRATFNDIAQVARRYLVFLLLEAGRMEPQDVQGRARALHNEVIEAARAVAAGQLTGDAREARTAALRAAFQELLSEPDRDGAETQATLADISLDLEFIAQGGNVPSSLRLAREVRG